MSLVATINFHALQLLNAAINVKPNPNGLPGSSQVSKLIDGLAAFALLGCAAGMVIGGAQWALGNRSHNYSHSADGKQRFLYGAGGAFGIGAAAAIINFFFNAGSSVH